MPKAWSRALGKDFFFKKNLPKNWFHRKKNLCRGPNGWPSAKLDGNGRRDPTGLICQGHRQRFDLPWACLYRGPDPQQRPLCRGPFFAEGSCGWPSAKSVFDECPRFGPRQSLRPSAEHAFPVVMCPNILFHCRRQKILKTKQGLRPIPVQ